MNNALIQLGIFIAIGLVWRYFKPGGVAADSLQRAVMTLIQWIFLPILVFFAFIALKLNASEFRFSMYAIGASAVAMLVAWFWFSRTNLEPRSKGALLLASSFGSVIFIGLPLTGVMIGTWTSRFSVLYLVVVNVVVMYTVGLFLARALGKPGKLKLPLTAFTDEAVTILKEPVIIAAILGLLVNMTDTQLPVWFAGVAGLSAGALIPLLALTVGLSITWDQNWTNQLNHLLPVAVIKLALAPLAILLMLKFFPSPGVQTSKALLLNTMMPASLLGIAVCDRFKLDTKTYIMAFVVTTVLAAIAVPVWLKYI